MANFRFLANFRLLTLLYCILVLSVLWSECVFFKIYFQLSITYSDIVLSVRRKCVFCCFPVIHVKRGNVVFFSCTVHYLP